MKWAARTDTNQIQIVEALRKAGRFVHVMSGVGGGFPDLLVAQPRTGRVYLLEVKDPKKKIKLTEAQKKFWKEWPLSNLHIVRTIAESLEITR